MSSGGENPRARRILGVALLLFGVCRVVGAQDSSANGDLDHLFNQNGTVSSDANGQGTPPDQSPASGSPPGGAAGDQGSLRPDDPTKDQKIHYFGNLDIYGLVGLGYSRLPSNPTSGFGNEGSGSLAATLGVDIRPSPELRLSATLGYNFPRIGTQLSELIIDYSVQNMLFFRIGIFDTTWGNSQFFQLTNLPSRGLPGWGVSNEPLWQQINIITKTAQNVLPVSVKLDIPIGLSNLTLLSRFDMANYGFPDTSTPDPLFAGYGIRYDVPIGPIEWSVAGFYQYLLNPRTSLGMKTSILGFDVFAESTVAFPVSLSGQRVRWRPTSGGGIEVGNGQRIYPSVVAGLSREWTDPRIKLYGEYAFNSERSPGISWLEDSAGPGGHNSAVVLRFGNVFGSAMALNALWQQNWSDGSGLVSTLLELSPARLATLQVGPVLLYGRDGNEVISSRLVPGNKRLELLILLRVSTSYRQ